jgi:anti-sigma regulatory factor (Ser/Thr protein kinase)/GNAT superfamily N-acetyltransferase
MAMHLELSVNSDPRLLGTVRAFCREALRQTSLKLSEIDKLTGLVECTAQAAMTHAYPAGEDGVVKVGVSESLGKLVVTVRDYGMPQDIATLERELHRLDASNVRLFGISCGDIADEVHWVGYGPEGKALQISKWLHDAHIVEQVPGGELEAFDERVALAPPQRYTIRPMVSEEAVQVSQLIYRAYGGSYFNQDVYYPERIVAQHERGTVLSFVAQGENGELAGHYALERNQEGPVVEGGQAVVDPAHRGRGLLGQMKEAAIEAARQLGLIGLYADAVTVHTLTQKSNVDHGARLCCVDLGMAPASEHFRGISEQQPQRVTCLMYFLWLHSPQPRTLYVPLAHRAVIESIFRQLDCPIACEAGSPPSGHGTLTVRLDAGARKAFIRVEQTGADSVPRVRHAKRELTEHSHAEAVFVELPLQDPGTPQIALDLERHGFAFAGVAPHFSPRGDVLRLVYLTEPLARGPIQTYEAFADSLVDHVLAEQARVRTALD